MWAFADALHDEYRRIVDAGFLLSVDDAVLWHKYATIRLAGGSDDDYRRWAEPRVEALNHALERDPRGPRALPHLQRQRPRRPRPRRPLRELIDLVLKVNAATT